MNPYSRTGTSRQRCSFISSRSSQSIAFGERCTAITTSRTGLCRRHHHRLDNDVFDDFIDSNDGAPRHYVARTFQALQYVPVHNLGDRLECRFCQSLMWLSERVVPSSTHSPLFNICCGRGRLSSLSTYPDLPSEFIELLTTPSTVEAVFRRNVTAINSILSFGSVISDINRSLHNNQGVFTYSVSGNIHHRFSDIALVPENARFGNLLF